MGSFQKTVAGIANDIVDTGLSLIGLDAQKDANKDLMNWQNTNEIKMWQMNNEYNSPANQMKRLQEAGVNPNLAFSNGQLSNVSASSPRAGGTSVSQPNMGNSSILDAILIGEQIESADADQTLKGYQAQHYEALISTEKARQLQIIADTMGQEWLNQYNRNTEQTQVDILNATLAEAYSRIQLQDQQTITEQCKQTLMDSEVKLNNQQVINLRKGLQKLDSEIARNYNAVQVGNSTIALNNQKIAESQQNIAESQQNIAESKSRVDVNNQNIAESKSRVGVNNQKVEESKANTKVLSQQEYRFKLENTLRECGLTPSDPLYYRLLIQMQSNPKYITGYIMSLETGRLFEESVERKVDIIF